MLSERTPTANGRDPRLSELAVSIVETDAGFQIVGELTEGNVHLLAAASEPFVAAGRGLTLDLTGLSYVDAAALHVIADIAARIDGGERVILKSPDPWVRKVIGVVGIDRLPNLDVEGAAQ